MSAVFELRAVFGGAVGGGSAVGFLGCDSLGFLQDLGVVFAFADQPFRRVGQQSGDFVGGEGVGDFGAGEAGVGDAQFAGGDVAGEGAGAAEVGEPLRGIGAEGVEVGAGEGGVAEGFGGRGKVDAELVGCGQRLHHLGVRFRAHRDSVSGADIVPGMSRFESIDVARLRWFVAVAEELHFARAAKGLNISRQRLSQTVIDLEEELGTKLFVPGAQPTQLTEDGEELLGEARELVAQAAEEVVEETSDGPAALRVGFVPGVTVSKWTRIWSERFPDTSLEVVGVPMGEQEAALREGRVDLCFVRLPIDRDGMSAIPLYRELPVVVVPKDHPISVFEQVSMADLADERIQDASDIDAVEGAIELVAAGVGVAVVPHSIARLHARRDLVYRTVTDVANTEIALAWPTDQTSDLVEDFVGVVRGRSERSSRAPAARAKSPEPQKKSAAKRSGGRPSPARNSVAKKKPAKRRGR